MRPLILLPLTVPMLWGQNPGTAAEAQVRATVEAYHRAFEARDIEGIRHQLSPDLVVFEMGGVDRGRDSYLGHHLGPELKELTAWSTTNMEIKIQAQERLAYATCAFTFEASFANGKTSKGKATETLLLTKEDGRWIIRHLHWSSRPLKPGKP